MERCSIVLAIFSSPFLVVSIYLNFNLAYSLLWAFLHIPILFICTASKSDIVYPWRPFTHEIIEFIGDSHSDEFEIVATNVPILCVWKTRIDFCHIRTDKILRCNADVPPPYHRPLRWCCRHSSPCWHRYPTLRSWFGIAKQSRSGIWDMHEESAMTNCSHNAQLLYADRSDRSP